MTNEGGSSRPPKSGGGRRGGESDDITRQLRVVYDEVADQSLPDELLKLLDQLNRIELEPQANKPDAEEEQSPS